MDAKAAFAGYEEGPLLFRPTYRYDLGTDNYDTSEKMRIPAWTGKLATGIGCRTFNNTDHLQTAYYTAAMRFNLLSILGQSYEDLTTSQVRHASLL